MAVKTKAKSKVTIKASMVSCLLPFIKFKWAKVMVAPEDNNIIV